MPSEESGVNKQESTNVVSQAAPTPSVSTRSPPPSANANERAILSHSHPLIDSRNLVITGGHFHHTLGHHTNLAIHINQGSSADLRSSSPALNEINNITPAQFSEQRSEVNRYSTSNSPVDDHESLRNQTQGSSQSREISFKKSNDIYARHLTPKGRGFPLWIPDSNRHLHLSYRRTGVRIGDVGIITESGAFSFLFNICLSHDDPVNPRTLPEHFSPISPPIEAADIENFKAFKNGDHLCSASVRRSQSGTAISDIVFESSASEGAILTMPRGARSEKLGNLARFREYEAANIANWYRYVNGPRGREAKNGDIRLVVGFDKTTSWGIATFANQTQENSCHFKFGPSDGDSASTYTWSEYSGVADVRAGPDSDEIDELRIDSDPPDVQFENQCLFVRTLTVTLADDVWADIHSSSDSNLVDPRNSQYPRVKNYSYINRPQADNGSNFSTSQGGQSGYQRRLQGVDRTSDKKSPIFVSGPVESITAHPSKVLNDALLAKIPNAKMVITHDDDWSSVTQYDTLMDPHEFLANILASRDICQENGVVFLEPKKIINEISEIYNFPGHCLSNAFVYEGSLQGRAIAVKRFQQDLTSLTAREVSILQQSDDHPNVVRYFYQESDPKLYTALDLFPCSLADIFENLHGDVENKRREEVKDIAGGFDEMKAMMQIASGLRHLHGLGLVHRDIKPPNILISSSSSRGRYRILISDFNLRKERDVDQSSLAGTAGWRAPEMIQCRDDLDKLESLDTLATSDGTNISSPPTIINFSSGASTTTFLTKSVDIFALGCLFYYILTKGGHPYGNRFDRREANIIKEIKDLSHICSNKEAYDLITHMLHRQPSRRPDIETCLHHPFFLDSAKRFGLDTITERPTAHGQRSSPDKLRGDESTSTTDLGSGLTMDVDGVKKVRKEQINALARMLSALRR